jgi:hypothetical protein
MLYFVLRYALKAYNFYLFPENEIDAFDFRSKVKFSKVNRKRKYIL